MNLNKNFRVVAIIGSLYYLFVLGISLLLGISQQSGVFSGPVIISSVLQNILAIFALLLSLYTANIIKTKFKDANKSLLRGSLIAMIASILVFLLVYILLPLHFIDNRTAEGLPAFIDFESLWHFSNGFIGILLIFLASLFF